MSGKPLRVYAPEDFYNSHIFAHKVHGSHSLYYNMEGDPIKVYKFRYCYMKYDILNTLEAIKHATSFNEIMNKMSDVLQKHALHLHSTSQFKTNHVVCVGDTAVDISITPMLDMRPKIDKSTSGLH